MIRQATLDDVGGIILCWQAAFAEKVKPQTVLTKIGVEDHTTLVYQQGEQITGFLIAYKHPQNTHWRVDYVASHPLDAAKGTGTALMLAIENLASKCSVPEITLAVRRKNVRARRLYEYLGYELTAERASGFSYRRRIT